jgi:hypothetical protein
MNLNNILNGKDRKVWKLEDRLTFVNNELNSKRIFSIEELNSFSDSIAYLNYNSKKGSLKNAIKENRFEQKNIDELITKISNFREKNYNEINIQKNEYVSDILNIYNNKEIDGKKLYFLNDRFNAIEEKLNNVDINNCSLKDIDSLKYVLLSFEKDNYMKRKAKDDVNFSKLKLKMENKLKDVIKKSEISINQYAKSYLPKNEEEIKELKENIVKIPEIKQEKIVHQLYDENKETKPKIIIQENETPNSYKPNLEEQEKNIILQSQKNTFIKEQQEIMPSLKKLYRNSLTALAIIGSLTLYTVASNLNFKKYFNKNKQTEMIIEKLNDNIIGVNNEHKEKEIKNKTITYEHAIDSVVNNLKKELKEKTNSKKESYNKEIIQNSYNKNEFYNNINAQDLHKNYSNFKCVVDKSNQKMFLMGYNNTWDVIDSYSISTGRNKGNKQRSGDNKTPEGKFKVISIENSSHWVHRSGRKDAYGPYFIRLETGFPGIGAHETDKNHLIGTPDSEGCIRFPQGLATYLVENNILKRGTFFEILPENTCFFTDYYKN